MVVYTLYTTPDSSIYTQRVHSIRLTPHPHNPPPQTHHQTLLQVQCALFSATMPLEVLEVTNKFMRDPVRILVKRDELTLEGA